ncbi:sulfatase-like hydrolase/transferase [Streptococcus suis]|nr:sulfatase-like hydrolase/transferase [Streptococcus suis]NQJ75871.1 sulfatase-like hydrolase/transferase [Streptococcus suis]
MIGKIRNGILGVMDIFSENETKSLKLFSIFLVTNTVLFYPIVFSYFSIKYDVSSFFNFKIVSSILLLFIVLGSIINYFLLIFLGRIRNILVPICSILVMMITLQFITDSSQINTPGFEIWNLDFTIFFSFPRSWAIGLLFIFLMIMTVCGKNISRKQFSSNSIFINIVLTNVFFSLFSNLTWFKEQFWLKLFELAAISDNILSNHFVLAIVSYIFVFLIVKACNDLLNNRSTISLSLFTSFLLAVLLNFFLQFGIRKEEVLLGEYVFPGAMVFQIVILTTVFFSIYLVINRYMVTTISLSLLVYIATVANQLKFEFRNEPLLYSDLSWIKDIGLIFSFVDVKYLQQLIVYTLLAAVLFFIFLRKIQNTRIVRNNFKRLLLLCLPISVFSYIFTVFESEKDRKIETGIPILSKLNNNYDIGWLSFAENARYKSVAYVWIKQLTKPLIEKPNSYSKEEIDKLIEKYSIEADRINEIRTEKIEEQTVIFVLSESFADPSRLTNVTVSEDVIPNIRSIISQNTGGLMVSDGYGGGTANMEFQALTGLAYRSFSDSVSIAYTEVVPKLSYIPSISNSFSSENRFVIHPASSTNYNRKNIYSTLQFEKFIAHINSDEQMDNVEVVGANISDRTAYSNVLNRLDEESNQFFSLITMQNHIPHILETPESITAEGTYLSEDENKTISNYARLLSVTDSETKQFLDKLSEFNKKITVVFYGDHLPGIYPDSIFQEESEKQYLTDFFIWSNYQINKTQIEKVYSSDFIAALLEHTNSKVTPYQALLTRVAEESNNSIVDGEALNDLKLLEYDLTEGKNYLQGSLDFFE